MYQVISEGFRRGILPQTARECTKAWKIPGDNFVIPKGMNVIIPSVRKYPVKAKGTKIDLFSLALPGTLSTGLIPSSLTRTGSTQTTRGILTALCTNLLAQDQGSVWARAW